MKYQPYEYQQYCIDKVMAIPKLALFLDCGLGKSSIALTAVNHLRYHTFSICKTLVIEPKRVAEGTWMQEKDKWDHLHLLRMQLVSGTQKQRIKALYTPADVWVIGRDNVTWLVDYFQNDWPFDCVIVDESSSFKSSKAKRWKALAAMFPHITRCVLLTGTPSPNSLEDLWAQVYLLDRGERLGKYLSHFRDRYFDETKGYGREQRTYSKYQVKQGGEETILQRISDICISMRASDYLDLPDLIYDTIPVVLDDKARKAYDELEKKMVLDLPEDEDEISVTSAAALSNKLLQLANGAVYDEAHDAHEVHDNKLDALMELLEGLHERGKAALVFYQFQHDRDRILAMLPDGYTAQVLSHANDVERWNRGEIDVLIAHPASAGYGLNLQDGGHHVIWFGLTWNYEQYTQANARLHRQGQQEKVIVHQLVVKDSRDEDVIEALGDKRGMQDWVLDSLKARVKRIRARHD